MTAKKNFWITGGALLVLGVVAAVIGGQATSAEMDAIDAAGPGGPAGTWLSLGGIATIAFFLLTVAGITVLVVGIVRAARAKDRVVQPD